MVGHGGSSAGSYLADPTSPIPSHCASIAVTSTLRVNCCSFHQMGCQLLIQSWVNALVLCCSMTPGLNKDIRGHVWPDFFYTCKSSRLDIRLSAWWLHMVTLIFLGVCVRIYGLTYSLYHPRGDRLGWGWYCILYKYNRSKMSSWLLLINLKCY